MVLVRTILAIEPLFSMNVDIFDLPMVPDRQNRQNQQSLAPLAGWEGGWTAGSLNGVDIADLPMGPGRQNRQNRHILLTSCLGKMLAFCVLPVNHHRNDVTF